MDLKIFIADLQKTKSINSQFQTKLGELTLWLNSIQNLDKYNPDHICIFIKTLQEFLCHKFYLDFLFQKCGKIYYHEIDENVEGIDNDVSRQTGSIYDNSMNLILVISAKIANMSNGKYAKFMIESFVDHLNSHVDCFNYIISFFRLYINCNPIKQAGKEYELYNNLFEIYKKVHGLSHSIESMHRIRDLKVLVKLTDRDKDNYQKENKNDRKYFLDNFKFKEKNGRLILYNNCHTFLHKI
jgi:hypothetical protein